MKKYRCNRCAYKLTSSHDLTKDTKCECGGVFKEVVPRQTKAKTVKNQQLKNQINKL